jgi:hypothetical protein
MRFLDAPSVHAHSIGIARDLQPEFPNVSSQPLKDALKFPACGHRAEGEGKMNRLQKFVESGAYGEGLGRHAYVLQSSALPAPSAGMEWHLVEKFSAADEVFENSGLKAVFKTTIEKGCTVVARG